MVNENSFDFKLPLSAVFVKYAIFFFNFLAFILGLVLIGTSISVAGDYASGQPLSVLFHDNYGSLPIFIGISGIILSLLCFFGCFGAMKESWGMLICYGVSLTLLCLCILIGGICGYVYRDQVEDMVKTSAEHSITNWCPHSTGAFGWNSTQHNLACCGAKSPADWNEKSDVFHLMALGRIAELKLNETIARKVPVPDACCKTQTEDCGLKSASEIYKDGCLQSLEGSMQDNLGKIGSVAVGISLFEIGVIVLSFILAKQYAKKDEFYRNLA